MKRLVAISTFLVLCMSMGAASTTSYDLVKTYSASAQNFTSDSPITYNTMNGEDFASMDYNTFNMPYPDHNLTAQDVNKIEVDAVTYDTTDENITVRVGGPEGSMKSTKTNTTLTFEEAIPRNFEDFSLYVEMDGGGTDPGGFTEMRFYNNPETIRTGATIDIMDSQGVSVSDGDKYFTDGGVPVEFNSDELTFPLDLTASFYNSTDDVVSEQSFTDYNKGDLIKPDVEPGTYTMELLTAEGVIREREIDVNDLNKSYTVTLDGEETATDDIVDIWDNEIDLSFTGDFNPELSGEPVTVGFDFREKYGSRIEEKSLTTSFDSDGDISDSFTFDNLDTSKTWELSLSPELASSSIHAPDISMDSMTGISFNIVEPEKVLDLTGSGLEDFVNTSTDVNFTDSGIEALSDNATVTFNKFEVSKHENLTIQGSNFTDASTVSVKVDGTEEFTSSLDSGPTFDTSSLTGESVVISLDLENGSTVEGIEYGGAFLDSTFGLVDATVDGIPSFVQSILDGINNLLNNILGVIGL